MITYMNVVDIKFIKYDRVRNSSGRLFQYFGAATVKAASAYIDETSGTESFISSHLQLGRVVARIMSPFDRYDGTPIYIALLVMQRRRNLHKSRNINHPRVAIMECIDMVISLRFSLNNMRTALCCIESNFFINFCGMLMKSELQYLSRLNTNECNNYLVKLNVSLEQALPILYRK